MGFIFKYRDEFKWYYNLGEYWIEVEMEDLVSFDEDLVDYLYKQLVEYLQLLEEVVKEVVDEVIWFWFFGEEVFQDIQVMFKLDVSFFSICSLKLDMMLYLVKIFGIIIVVFVVCVKVICIFIQCCSCCNIFINIVMCFGFEGYVLFRKCNIDQVGCFKCLLDLYFIMFDKCKCVDFQILKLQELFDVVFYGEMFRYMQFYCDRYLCDKVVFGNRVIIMGIYFIKKFGLIISRGCDRVGVGI